jgi:hypothetical protein
MLPKVPAKQSPVKNETPFFLEEISGRLKPSLNLSEKKALQSLLTLNEVKSNVRMHEGQTCRGTVQWLELSHVTSFSFFSCTHESVYTTQTAGANWPIFRLRNRKSDSFLQICSQKKINPNFRKSFKIKHDLIFSTFLPCLPHHCLFSLLIL